MGFLRRLLGGDGRDGRDGTADADAGAADRHEPRTAAELDAEERAHELELARFEAERTDDLVLRQQRYADRSWTPPAQGGERRAEDADAAS
jgi:hypothetical protein